MSYTFEKNNAEHETAIKREKMLKKHSGDA